MTNPLARIWKEHGKWWAQTFSNGRCDWLQGNFKSAKQAEKAADERIATYE